jgi:Methyltransferase domain
MSLAHKVSGFNRRRKWSLFLKELEVTRSTRVLDVGFAGKEYSPTDNFIEKHYPYRERLTALGIDTPNDFKQKYPEVRVVRYSGDRFPFADKEFDVCWSNAVLEHVGGQQRQRAFLSEITRVSRRAFITTPNKLFPIEVHTRTPLLHYLPKNAFDKYLTLTGKHWATGDYMHLLSECDLRRLLASAGVSNYKLFRNRLLGFAVDFAVVLDCNSSKI